MTGLTYGSTYRFKVQAGNDFGLSQYSSEITLICAFTPDAPEPPITSVLGN